MLNILQIIEILRASKAIANQHNRAFLKQMAKQGGPRTPAQWDYLEDIAKQVSPAMLAAVAALA
jgi:hypothetical protein